jgi:hypothetical protein
MPWSITVEAPSLQFKHKMLLGVNTTGKDIILHIFEHSDIEPSDECCLSARIGKKIMQLDLSRPIISYDFDSQVCAQ